MPAKKLDEHSSGRIIRTLFGAIIILIDVATLAVSHVILPLRTGARPPFEIKEISFHALFLVIGVMLMNKATGTAILEAIKGMLPGGKKT